MKVWNIATHLGVVILVMFYNRVANGSYNKRARKGNSISLLLLFLFSPVFKFLL